MKVYKDFDEVIEPTEIPEELLELDRYMRKKPNFDKTVFSEEYKKRRNDFEII